MLNLTGALAAITTVAGLLTSPPEPVVFDVLTFNGTGCRPGSFDVRTLPDNAGFAVRHRGYHAKAGDGVPLVESRKNCQLSLSARVPEGYTWAVTGTTVTGSADLAAGANAVRRNTFYFAGSITRPWSSHRLRGPVSTPWDTADAESDLVWVPCGQKRAVSVSTDVRLDRGTSRTLSVSTVDEVVHHLAWKRC